MERGALSEASVSSIPPGDVRSMGRRFDRHTIRWGAYMILLIFSCLSRPVIFFGMTISRKSIGRIPGRERIQPTGRAGAQEVGLVGLFALKNVAYSCISVAGSAPPELRYPIPEFGEFLSAN